MNPITGGLGAKADMSGSANEQYGGTFTFVTTQTSTGLVGIVRFQLNKSIKGRASRKRGGAGTNRLTPLWYCPFTAKSVDDFAQIAELDISEEDLFLLGAEGYLENCYRSRLPPQLTSREFHSGRFRNCAGIRDVVYRIPKTSFTSTFFSGKGKYLSPSLGLFVQEVTNGQEGAYKFSETKLSRVADFRAEMLHIHDVDTVDRCFQAKLYGAVGR